MVWTYLELFCLLSLALILVSYPDWILSEDKMGRGISIFFSLIIYITSRFVYDTKDGQLEVVGFSEDELEMILEHLCTS